MTQGIVSQEDLFREIEIFETEIALRKQGKLDEKIFAELRLRRGVYGQRYDNGQRHDGKGVQSLPYPSGELLKGPNTLWDAPGMQRIKVPFGGLTPEQLERIAELAEEYSDGVAHITTRQDFQLHYVHIDDTPAIMRRLAEVGITTREACGNSVRNVTTCPIAGVCRDEPFDVTPYARACAMFLLGHPDAQNFGRKFKISFSGCRQHACGLASIHDFAAIAAVRTVDGETRRGFELYVGGGLGAVPHKAKLFSDFVPEEEILPLVQAVARVFSKLGEKKNRARARLKFLVQKLGIEEFRRLVLEERAGLPEDPCWRDLIRDGGTQQERSSRQPGESHGQQSDEYHRWLKENVYFQKQSGFVTLTIKLPLGDITAQQLRKVADIARQFLGNTIRTTVEQNMVLRWVNEADLPQLYDALKEYQLTAPGPDTVEDIVACPGSDTCKLGISSSRGLAAELQERLQSGLLDPARRNGNGHSDQQIDEMIRSLHIKISGCFNSCGHHHIADLGFYGVSRKVGAHSVPHFQVVLGGQWSGNAGAYGLAIGAVPSKRIPEVVLTLVKRFVDERESQESFQKFIQRIGKVEVRSMLQKFMDVPEYDQDMSFYSDWGDTRVFTLGDMGAGECAGEVITPVEFELSKAERQLFEAQLFLDNNAPQKAADLAYRGMLGAARALVKLKVSNISESAEEIVQAFSNYYYDTELFFDPFAGGKFARYLFAAHSHAGSHFNDETAHRFIEEAQLFVEAAYACYARMFTDTGSLINN